MCFRHCCFIHFLLLHVLVGNLYVKVFKSFEKGRVGQHLKSSLELPVLIVNSGVPKETREQVAKVRAIYEKHTPIIEHLLSGVDCLVEHFADIIQRPESSSCFESLNELITINQGVLYSFQVSHSCLNEIANVAQEFGLHCKITGSGGGGCCFILLDKAVSSTNVDEMVQVLARKGFTSFRTKLGCEGVTFED